MATHSSIRTWKIPRTEELGGLQSLGVTKESGATEQPHKKLLQVGWECTDSLVSMMFVSEICFLKIFIFQKFIYFKIEGYLLYRILLVSAKPSAWISHRYTYVPPSWTSLPPPSPSHLSRLLQSPCLSSLSHFDWQNGTHIQFLFFSIGKNVCHHFGQEWKGKMH